MTARRLIAAALIALACALLAVGCGGDRSASPASGGTRSARLILDWFPNPDHAGIYGAIDEGFFTAAGVTVTPEVPSDPSASLKRLVAGRAQFAISYEPEVLLARARGLPVVAVGALVTRPLNCLIYRTDRVPDPKALAGKTVGIAGVPSDRPLLDAVVRGSGGDPSKVDVRTVGFNLAPALAAGRVDAVIGAYWNIELVDLRRKHVPVAALRLDEHGVPRYDELVVVTTDPIARSRPDLVRAFLRGLRKGQDWAATDEAGAVAHLVAANPDLDKETARAQLHATAPVLSPADEPALTVHPADWVRFAEWMRQSGLLTGPLDANRAVTDRFLPGH